MSKETLQNVGAGVMGRNMFGPARGGAWGDEQWTGWWGDNPPYHYDVFILTHYARDPVAMEGGTTFHFVTDGVERAVEQAREAANGRDVMLWGGAQAIQQYVAAGLLDELELHVVPVLLGDGARLFDTLGDAEAGAGARPRGAWRDAPQVQARDDVKRRLRRDRDRQLRAAHRLRLPCDIAREQLLQRSEITGLRGSGERRNEPPVIARADWIGTAAEETSAGPGHELPRVRLGQRKQTCDLAVWVVEGFPEHVSRALGG